MAYKVIILYRLYMPSYVLGTFTEYPKIISPLKKDFLFTDKSVFKWGNFFISLYSIYQVILHHRPPNLVSASDA